MWLMDYDINNKKGVPYVLLFYYIIARKSLVHQPPII